MVQISNLVSYRDDQNFNAQSRSPPVRMGSQLVKSDIDMINMILGKNNLGCPVISIQKRERILTNIILNSK